MSDRIKVRNGGKIVRVTKNELEKYLTKGYEIVEDKATEKQETVSQEPIIEETKIPVEVESRPRNTRRKRSN